MQPDFVLIHAPSVFDFRERAITYGPISDVIPSTPVFEMYPVGFLTMAAYLRRHGYRVRIINLALMMLRSRRFRPEKFLAKFRPKMFGIDLHWLPHAHGSIEVARLLKKLHPDIPIVFGGISATYFHDELIRDPAVDFVLRGSITEPSLLALMQEIGGERHFDRVPGLKWKGGVNADAPIARSLDDYPIDLGMMVSSVVKSLDFWSSIPFHWFWRHPITAVFTVRGCARGCITCGASSSSFRRFMPGRHPILRSPDAIAAQVRDLAAITRAPIFLVGDLRDGGERYAHAVLEALAGSRVSNRIVFEFFDAPDDDFLARIDSSVDRWGAELSPESHDESVRALMGKGSFTNARLEAAIETMMRLRCEQLDLFYMVGLPGQTFDGVLATVTSIEGFFQRFDRRLSAFITPMAPFLDPGSDGFEQAEMRGYIVHAKTLAEHRALLEKHDWAEMLNYETRWMTRREIVDATRLVSGRLNALKRKYGRTPGKSELFPAGSFLSNFRIGGILRLVVLSEAKDLRLRAGRSFAALRRLRMTAAP